MKQEWDASRLDVRAFARAAGQLRGQAPLSAWTRLSQDAAEPVGEVRWSLSGQTRPVTGGPDQVWLRLQAELDIVLTCQRCLTSVACPLQVERAFRFVADESLAEQEDEDAEEDVLVWSASFDALDLIEDELIMALPMIPMHPACDSEHVPTSEYASPAEVARPNPFAVLAKLRADKSD